MPHDRLTRLEIEAVAAALRAARRLNVPPGLTWADLRQEAMLAVWQQRARVRPGASEQQVKRYLARRALGAVIDAVRHDAAADGITRGTDAAGRRCYRGQGVLRLDGLSPDERPALADPPDRSADPLGLAIVAQALAAIQRMPAPLPTVAAMSIAGATGEQIAKFLGVTGSAVSQARAKLAKRLRRFIAEE